MQMALKLCHMRLLLSTVISKVSISIWVWLSNYISVTQWYVVIIPCPSFDCGIQYTPRNMHTVFALLCFVVVIHWLIFPYPSGLHHWHCGNLTIAPVPAKQPWWIGISTSCEFIMNDYITKQSTTKPCAYFLGYTVVNADEIKVLMNSDAPFKTGNVVTFLCLNVI